MLDLSSSAGPLWGQIPGELAGLTRLIHLLLVLIDLTLDVLKLGVILQRALVLLAQIAHEIGRGEWVECALHALLRIRWQRPTLPPEMP